MALADLASNRSTCLVRKVGAIIVRNNQVLATGYNGSPSGAYHCSEVKHCSLGTPDCVQAENIPSMAIHAEINAICQAAKYGVPVEGATIYVTHAPCLNCLKAVISCGIQRIVYREQFPMNYEKKKIQDYLLSVSDITYSQTGVG